MNIYSEDFVDDIYCSILNILAIRDEKTSIIIGSKRISRTEILSHFEKFQDSIIECLLTILSNKDYKSFDGNERAFSFGYIGGKNAGFFIKEFEKLNDELNEELSDEQKQKIQIAFDGLKSNDKIAIQLIAMLSGLENNSNSVKKHLQTFLDKWIIKGEYVVRK